MSVSASPAEFDAWVQQRGWGVAFHTVYVVGDIARVAARVAPLGVWTPVGLYRRSRGTWSSLHFQPMNQDAHYTFLSNLYPSVLRDYGAEDPITVTQLDARMEAIGDLPDGAVPSGDGGFFIGRDFVRTSRSMAYLGQRHAPLLRRYLQSRNSRVRHAAIFEYARLTGESNVPFLIATIEGKESNAVRLHALQQLDGAIERTIEQDGRAPLPAVAAALTRTIVEQTPTGTWNGPSTRPSANEVSLIRLWRGLAVVDVSYNSGSGRGGSGYRMVWKRRGSSWRFVTSTRTWIS